MAKAKDSQKIDDQPQQNTPESQLQSRRDMSDSDRLDLLRGAIEKAAEIAHPALCGREIASYDSEGREVYGRILSFEARLILFREAFATIEEAMTAID